MMGTSIPAQRASDDRQRITQAPARAVADSALVNMRADANALAQRRAMMANGAHALQLKARLASIAGAASGDVIGGAVQQRPTLVNQLKIRVGSMQDAAAAQVESPAGLIVQRAITVAGEAKSLIFLAVKLEAYMGDYGYALASLQAVDGNTYGTMELLKAALPAPLGADQLYVGGAAVTVEGIGGRCNEHMTHNLVMAALRKNKGSVSIANGDDQRVQIGEGLVRGWKWGYICLKYQGGNLKYWHAHDGFQVG